MKKQKLASSQLLPDETENLDVSIAKRLDELKREPYKDLAKQCREEAAVAWEHQKPKKSQQLIRLKLYNNQKRNPEAIGDTTMQDMHQTITAALFIDRLAVEWTGMEEGDDDQAEALNHLSEYDYVQMQKDQIDYDWDWDAGFFGRGLCFLEQYIRDPKYNIYLPVPEVLDPSIHLRDPKAKSINGKNIMGAGAARFHGYPVRMTKRAMLANPHFFKGLDFSTIRHDSGLNAMDLLRESHEARNNAQNLQNNKPSVESLLGDNGEYDLFIWYTHFDHNGGVRKVKVWLANDLTDVVGIQDLEPVGTPEWVSRWKLIDRPLYPHSHDYDGTSVPDLTEDKQRARAVAVNLGMRAVKSDLYANYLYDSTRITNRNDLKTGFNKMIPVDGNPENAITAVRKSQPNMALLNFIYQSLDLSAQKATATPEVSQGVLSRGANTLGEIDKVEAGAQNRRGLSARLFGMSERNFWRFWYLGYKENYAADGVDEKIIRINGAFGAKFRPLRRNDFITTKTDPDVRVESLALARAKQLEERQSLGAYVTMAVQDPTANRRYGMKKLGKSFGMQKDEIDRLFPATYDERIARLQNEQLNDNIKQPVLPEDAHEVHLIEHASAKDTPATKAHILAHEYALSVKKTRPELFPQTPDQQGNTALQGNNPPVMDANKAMNAPVVNSSKAQAQDRAIA